MSEYLRIDGNTVQRIQEQVVKEVSLESFVASIEANIPVESGMLPRDCIYFSQKNGRFVYVIEISAQLVEVKTRSRDNTTRNYRIAIPFTQFFVQGNPQNGALGNVFLTATRRPLRSMKDRVFVTPYPNIFNNGLGRLCTGSMSISTELPLDAKINAICNEFFIAAFNNDLQPGCPEGWSWSHGVDAYMQYWATLSSKNRCLMLGDEVKLQPHPDTPEAIISECFRTMEG